jgi:hypothetical protein
MNSHVNAHIPFVRSGLAFFLALLLASCTPPPPKTDGAEKAPRKPELSIQVATFNYASLARRLEKKDVDQLSQVLRREQIDVLAVHGLVRYPNVASRIDLLTELPRQIDMRTAFGEMMNNSGRQTGNAIFSAFPILSQHNQPFDGVKSASVEAAFRATIDGGVHSLMIVSANIPPKATNEELAQCGRMIAGLNAESIPMIATGNLSTPPKSLTDISAALAGGKNPAGTAMWYSGDVLKPTSVRIVQTDIGPLLVSRFDVFRNDPR